MADEIKQDEKPQEVKPVAEKTVTDADLSSAFDAAQQTEPEVQTEVKTEAEPKGEEHQEDHQEPDALPEEPADNAERSRLGRRLKQMEDFNKQILDELKSLKGGQPQQPVQQQIQESATYDRNYVDSQVNSLMEAAIGRGELPSTIVTPQDQYVVNKFMANAEYQISQEAERKFVNGYVSTLQSPGLKGDTPDDLHAEIIAELYRDESPFNKKRLANPQGDAYLNYMEAKTAILQKKLSENKPKNVFKGKPENSPATGTSVNTRTATVENDLPALDAYSMDFIKKSGMSPESVKAALSKEMPFHLRGMR